jgi:hypothetical protein
MLHEQRLLPISSCYAWWECRQGEKGVVADAGGSSSSWLHGLLHVLFVGLEAAPAASAVQLMLHSTWCADRPVLAWLVFVVHHTDLAIVRYLLRLLLLSVESCAVAKGGSQMWVYVDCNEI